MITRKVYLPHRKLWDSCYGAIFGDDNGKLFHNEKGLMSWNRTLFKKEKSLIVDIYRLTPEEVLRKSNYDGYIEKL
ncbi:hypothetical protein J2795_001659 [Chryseobacterium bernardetii]|uniref:Uncharacterized protein n=2 Tax=Chryseobacterium TaxID=59732 RepID=A0A543EIF8_9FLAO|nr:MULTISPECIES: hypothetical protein [Chryseobacterium]MDR6369798.1 hypothetical protein [Chryseobacterium vietnamense]MDR6440959.1 hypothetical protein [Chryseobacterium bernardetii]TQM21361.1 hypothetical protein FB551_1048 [Chryseobacterium aquifrigidense]